MTDDAKHEITMILVLAQRRLNYSHRPFHIICEMLVAYYREWGWV